MEDDKLNCTNILLSMILGVLIKAHMDITLDQTLENLMWVGGFIVVYGVFRILQRILS